MQGKAFLEQFIRATRALPNDDVQKIAALFEARFFTRYELFLEPGQICNEYCILETGFFRSFAINRDGEEVTTDFYWPNQVVAEPDSMFRRVPMYETFQALAPSLVWCISFDRLQEAFHTWPEFREFGRLILVGAYTRIKSRMLDSIHQRAEDRYSKLLEQGPEIAQYAQVRQIASYLGITDSSLSRIRKEITRA